MRSVGRDDKEVIVERDGRGVIVPWMRGGWWHDYVCPTHGVELDAPAYEAESAHFPCAYGCRWTGEPYASAWTVLEHQARARELRLVARRFEAKGDPADRDRALALLDAYAELYGEVAAAGWSDRAEPWMLRGKLFAQALTEAVWGVQVADAVRVLAAEPHTRAMLGGAVVDLMVGLAATVAEARRILVDERGDLRNNYTAWLDCAGGMAARALTALGEPADSQPWQTSTIEHSRVAILSDGWEWEAATYYHVFVLRAYLLSLANVDPGELPADVTDRLAGMVRVLTSLAAPSGYLPVLNDGPYERPGALLELIEVCALARQFWHSPGVDRIDEYARARLGRDDDGLADLLAGWFTGPPLPGLDAERGSVRFTDAGVLVLRDRADTWQAVVAAGPPGGSHGHLNKLGLYLYGVDAAWQPAPGVPPYGSPLRHGYYARTLAHPTVRVDGHDQQPCTGELIAWSDGSGMGTRAVVAADDAFHGVRLRRELVMTGSYLLDVVHLQVADGESPTISLGLRPGGQFDVRAAGTNHWRTRWGAGSAQLHGIHRASTSSRLVAAPGRGPSHDPAAEVTTAEWTADAANVTFVSVFWPEIDISGDADRVDHLELVPSGVVVYLNGGESNHHYLPADPPNSDFPTNRTSSNLEAM